MRRIATAMLLTLVAFAFGATAASAQSALANCKYYTKVLQDFAAGLPYCEQCLKEEPTNPEARFYAGWCLAEAGKFSEAHEAFAPLLGKTNDPDKSVRENAKMAEERVNQYARTHFNTGTEALGKGDMKTAHDEFQKAAAIDPNLAIAQVSLGYTAKQLGDIDGAIAAYRLALVAEPGNPDANVNMSAALTTKLDSLKVAQPPDSAQIAALEGELNQSLTAVTQIDTTKFADFKGAVATAHLQLAALQLEAGDMEKGLAHLNCAVAIDPQYSGDLFRTLYNAGLAQFEAKKYAEASQLLLKASETIQPTDPNWQNTMYNLGFSYFNAGEYAKCVETIEKLVAVSPQKDYYNMLMLAYGKTGDQAKYAAAAKKYEELAKTEGGK
jgi:tetratricopeptide (TPR) repeat protein